MPLVKPILQQGIKSSLEPVLKAKFKSPAVKDSLRKLLDGDSFAGKASSAKNISQALSNIKTGISVVASTAADVLVPSVAENIIKKFTSNEWANVISECVTEWMSEEIAPIIAESVAKSVADQVDLYVKSATIIIPPGIVVATTGTPAAQVGASTAPSPPALIT
jgi:hypothetical protein